MISSRIYLIRAMYDWIVDNQLTPYIMVDATARHIQVPENYIEEGKIILNVAPMAVRHLSMNNNGIEFDARFSGITHQIYVPVPAVMAIYAFENGRGMVFDEDDDHDGGDGGGDKPKPNHQQKPRGRPHLKIIK